MLQTADRTVTTILPNIVTTTLEKGKIRVAPYCRVSTDSEEQEHSFSAQLHYYTNLVESMPDSELVDIYADEGISGRGTKKREEFNRLMLDCRKGKIDRIITKSVSRFARNTVDCLKNVRLLSSYGVTVYFEKEDIDTAKMTNEMLLAISGMQAQEESISLGNNMRWSYIKRMEKGEFLGNTATYGYTLINSGRVIINEAEAKIVRLIKDLYLSGMGFQKISEYLNYNGIKRRNGKNWYPTTIKYILTNERYIGDALLQKSITINEYPPRRMLNDGSQPQYYVENCIPAIFTREERASILALIESRTHNQIEREYELTKLLRCNKCGYTFRKIIRKNNIVWRCSYYSSGKGCESRIAVNEDDVIKMFIRMINKLYNNRETLIIPIIKNLETMNSKINCTEIKVKTIDSEIAKLSKQSLVLSELIKNGILDTEDFYTQQNEISSRLTELRKKRRKYLNVNHDDETLKALYDLNELLEDIEGKFTEFDGDVIRNIVKHARVVSSTEIKIVLHCGLVLTEYLPSYYSKRRSTV